MMLPRINTTDKADMTTRKAILPAGVLLAAAALLWAAAPLGVGAQPAPGAAAIDETLDEAPVIPAELLRGVAVKQRQEQLELLALETRLANQVFTALQNEARLLKLLKETPDSELHRLHGQFQREFFPDRAGRGAARTRGIALGAATPGRPPAAAAGPEEETALGAGCGCLQSRVHWIGYAGDQQAILSHELIGDWMYVSDGGSFGDCSAAVTAGAEDAPDQGEVLLQCGGKESTLTLRENEGTG